MTSREQHPHANKKTFLPFYIQDNIRKFLSQHNGCVCKYFFYDYLLGEYPLRDFNLDVGVEELANAAPHILCVKGNKVELTCKTEISGDAQIYDDEQWTIPCVRSSSLEVRLGKCIEQLLEENPIGLTLDEIPHKYFYSFKSEWDIGKFGFRSLSAFVMLLPGNFQMVRTDQKYYLSKTFRSNKYNYRGRRKLILTGTSGLKDLKVQLQYLAFKYSYGLELHHFFNFIEGNCLFRVLLDDKGFSENEFAQYLASEHVITLKEIDGKLIVFPNNGWKFRDPITAPVPHYPENVMNPRDTIPRMALPSEGQAGILEFWGKVTTVNNPSDFFIRFQGTDHSRTEGNKFQTLLENMTTFYAKNYKHYAMPLHAVRVGMICTASIQGSYRRISVIGPANNSAVYVNDVDTGCNHLVALMDLLFLDKRHNFEIMTYQAKLNSIKPSTFVWSLDSLIYFADHVVDKDVYTHVCNTNGNSLLDVELRVEPDGLVGILLIKAGYAIDVKDALYIVPTESSPTLRDSSDV